MRTGKKGLRRFAAAICAVALCASMMPTSGLALEGDASTDSDAALVQTQEEVETAPSAALTDGEEQTKDTTQNGEDALTLTDPETEDPKTPSDTEPSEQNGATQSGEDSAKDELQDNEASATIKWAQPMRMERTLRRKTISLHSPRTAKPMPTGIMIPLRFRSERKRRIRAAVATGIDGK